MKSAAFYQIGLFFAIYAHRFGLRDNVEVDITGARVQAALGPTADPLGRRADFGVSRLRVELLQQRWRKKRMPLPELATLCRISQLAGYSRLFNRAYGKVKEKEHLLSATDLMLFEVLYLKLLVQRGSWASAQAQIVLIEQQNGWQSLLRFHSQLGAYNRRVMLVAARGGNIPPGWDNLEGNVPSSHYEMIANQVFSQIASLYVPAPLDLGSLSDELAVLREQYYTEASSKKETEIRFEKNAVALLYLEAAAYLKWGSEENKDRVVKLLYTAHLLNVRHDGNEYSDLFGEILNSRLRRTHRSIVSLAMRRDDEAAILMRGLVAQHNHKLADRVGQETLASLTVSPKERGNIIRRVLAH